MISGHRTLAYREKDLIDGMRTRIDETRTRLHGLLSGVWLPRASGPLVNLALLVPSARSRPSEQRACSCVRPTSFDAGIPKASNPWPC